MDASSDAMNNGIDRYIFSLSVVVVSVRRFEIVSSVRGCLSGFPRKMKDVVGCGWSAFLKKVKPLSARDVY